MKRRSPTKRRARERDTSHYEVGYGKPPKHSRFKPGGCGNPNGRPKGASHIKTDVRNTLKTPVTVTLNGRQRKVSTQQAILLRLREKALTGDRHAIDRMLQLARDYTPEELAAATAALSTDDLNALAVYQARVLSGAAHIPASDEDKNASSDALPVAPAPPDRQHEPMPIEKAPVARRRAPRSGPRK
jgi:hypothetical protein